MIIFKYFFKFHLFMDLCNKNIMSIYRYTASIQDPPRGGYYPTGTGNSQQPRQYQFSASNPWQREEKEKVVIFSL